MNVPFWLNIAGFVLILAWLVRRQLRGATTASGVLLGLVLGALYGVVLQTVHGFGHESIRGANVWIGIVSGGYLRLLQMIVMPLVLISILAAVTKLGNVKAVGKISVGVLGVLLATTAVSAAIGVGVTQLFGLSAESIVQGEREQAAGTRAEGRVEAITGQTVPQLLTSFIPTNVFSDLTGTRPPNQPETAVIGVVVFATLLGLAALGLRKKDPATAERIATGVDTLQRLVMQLVKIVLRLTPYGVFAFMTIRAGTSNSSDIMTLLGFVLASYVGLGLILGMHATLLAAAGLNPLRFFRRVWPVLTFAFSSRSSAATVPLTIETQVSRLGVPSGIATFAASFGATIGQNACAGLYPAMLAVMIAPGVGIDPMSPGFLGSLLLVTTLGSFGIAGFGGGATVAAILVLSTLGLPVALAGILVSIEPLIDMGRTAVNVSGALTAGVLTSRFMGETTVGVFEGDEAPTVVIVAEELEPVREPALVG
jgi:L-cystine uptake protein TcyP (sodium:dicarboxylate symporter family)